MARPAPKRTNTLEPQAGPEDLTPLRAHYLKRELVALQVAHEVDQVNDADALGLLGPPFSAPKRAHDADVPFLRFCFAHFVTTFPFLTRAPADFYSRKLQVFVQSFISRNISTSEDRDDDTKRRRIAGKLEKHLGLVISSAIKLTDNDGRETVIRVSPEGAVLAEVGKDGLVAPDPRVSLVATTDAQSNIGMTSAPPSKGLPNLPGSKSGEFDVNVVTIRRVTVKGRIRSKSHEEFIVRTRRASQDDVHVSKRYGDFTRLCEQLRAEFPESDVRPPPPKDRRSVEAHGEVSPRASGEYTPDTVPESPDPSGKPGSAPTLARERNRLTLRAYLRYLLGNPVVAGSERMRDFLLAEPVELTASERQGVAVREEMDRHREEELGAFRREVEGRVRELEQYLRGFREELVKRDGLSRVFSTIKTTEKLENLPIEYRKLLEWARISLASTIYSLFVGSDNSSNVFQQLKRIHGIMPYFMIKGILRISNPVAMIRAFLDLFLARPFGQSSLLQRMFTSGLSEEAKELRADMELVANKIAQPAMIAKVEAYVNAPRETQDACKREARDEGLDLMAVILRSPAEPQLDRASMQRVARANRAYIDYLYARSQLANPDEQDPGPSNDDAWLFEDLHVWRRLATRARDKEQLVELIFEGSTSELLKDMVTIFYQPLATVYKAANIADSIVDLQRFIDDLIKTIETAEQSPCDAEGGRINMTGRETSPQKTVQTFIDLVARHEPSFYHFVHQVHTKGAVLFDDLMHWIERIINFVRDGLPEPLSLEVLLPHTGPERVSILAEVDSIVDYHHALKAAHHERMRRRLVRGEAREADEDAEFVQQVMSNMSLGTVAGDVVDIQAAESDEELDGAADSDSDEFVDAPAGHDPSQPPPSKRKRHAIEPPHLVHLPQLSPLFVEMIRPALEAAQDAGALPNSMAAMNVRRR